MAKKRAHKPSQVTPENIALAAQAAREMAEAEAFGRAVRREHEALGKLLIMLDHVTGMPTIPAVVFEAREAFADIRLRTIKISAPKGCEIGVAHWVAR